MHYFIIIDIPNITCKIYKIRDTASSRHYSFDTIQGIKKIAQLYKQGTSRAVVVLGKA